VLYIRHPVRVASPAVRSCDGRRSRTTFATCTVHRDLLLEEDRRCIRGVALVQASVRAGLIRRIGKRPRTAALHLCGMRLNSPLATQGTSAQRHRGASAANARAGKPEFLDLSPAWAGYRTDNRSHRGPSGRLPPKIEREEENVGLASHLLSWPILTTKLRGQTAHWESDGRPLLLVSS
jgi:hypothetical protein